jgi:organic radical activating enzyme
LWAANGGNEWPIEHVAAEAQSHELPITILGGEPFDQPDALRYLLIALRQINPERHIAVYTGYTYEALRARAQDATDAADSIALALALIDLLVDGPFVYQADSPFVQWRGSANQRPIDLAAMRRAADWNTLILLPWDRKQTITISGDGVLEMTTGLARQFAIQLETEPLAARRCGQTPHSQEN